MKKSPLIPFWKYTSILMLTLIFIACSSDDNAPTTNSEMGEPEPEVVVENPLPLMSINTNGAVILDEPKRNATLTISKKDEVSFSGPIGIEIRGSSSQSFPKKGYGFETWDADGNDIDVSLLGMPEEEDWILHGPYSDKSLLRNIIIYDLAREMNHYASRTELVNLEINDSYRGVYVFMEKLKRDKERIDINKLKDDENEGEDLTGGYIIKIDKSDQEGYTDQNSFSSRIGSSIDQTGSPIRFLYDYPKAEDITSEQKTYISNYIIDFETALASENFTDVDTGYAQYIDVPSFVDFFILNELSNNVDGYRISTWMHKDKNEKLKMGPIWDFNLAFGNADYCSGGETNVWAHRFNDRCPGDFWAVPFWWSRLLEDPAFVAQLKERWNELRGATLSNTAILSKVDGYIDTLEEANAIKTNFDAWAVFGVYVWPNKFIGSSYAEETAYLKNWITDRTQWLDAAIDDL